MPKPSSTPSKQPKKPRGRPAGGKTFGTQLSVRIDDDVRAGIEKYREKFKHQAELREISDAVRHMLKRVLREEGLL